MGPERPGGRLQRAFERVSFSPGKARGCPRQPLWSPEGSSEDFPVVDS